MNFCKYQLSFWMWHLKIPFGKELTSGGKLYLIFQKTDLELICLPFFMFLGRFMLKKDVTLKNVKKN